MSYLKLDIVIAKTCLSIQSPFFMLMSLMLLLISAAIGAPRPSYPSSKPKRTDWDKLEAEVKKEVCLLTYLFCIGLPHVCECTS